MGIPGGGGERVLDQYLNTGLKPGAFLGQKILKYKRCLGQHSPRLVLKSFISHCNRVNSCDSHFFCILSCSADNYKFYQASQTIISYPDLTLFYTEK